MSKIRVLIVDDEPLAHTVLELHCSKIPNLIVVGNCYNANEAALELEKQAVDLMLLDVNMPKITGIDFARTLVNPPEIIFTTAYSEYAVTSYELNALDYLVKPISFERFAQAINKLMKKKASMLSFGSVSSTGNEEFIFVRSEGKSCRINLLELLFIEGMKDYTRYYTIHEKITVHGNLKKTLEMLEAFPFFVRVHKSYIVNSKKVKTFNSDGIELFDYNGTIPIGSSFSEGLALKLKTSAKKLLE